jgi:tetrahydromethanopterin S-methyltransferase subunit G
MVLIVGFIGCALIVGRGRMPGATNDVPQPDDEMSEEDRKRVVELEEKVEGLIGEIGQWCPACAEKVGEDEGIVFVRSKKRYHSECLVEVWDEVPELDGIGGDVARLRGVLQKIADAAPVIHIMWAKNLAKEALEKATLLGR